MLQCAGRAPATVALPGGRIPEKIVVEPARQGSLRPAHKLMTTQTSVRQERGSSLLEFVFWDWPALVQSDWRAWMQWQLSTYILFE
jgi:hypothetical protein